MASPQSEVLKNKGKQCRAHANFMLEAERQYVQQNLKTKHLLHADRGSKYFHSLIRRKNAKIFYSC